MTPSGGGESLRGVSGQACPLQSIVSHDVAILGEY